MGQGSARKETCSGGQFQIKRKTRGDRMRAKLKEIKEEMRQRRHHSGVVGQELCSIFEMWFLRSLE